MSIDSWQVVCSHWVVKNRFAMTLIVSVAMAFGHGPVSVVRAAAPVPVAHRGLLRHAPENTLPAFATCLELGMGFELDIRTTQDGHLVVLHDDNVERTTNGPSRSIQEMTLTEVRQLDAGSWFDPAFAGVRVPTLEETLALVKARKRGKTIIALNVKQLTPVGETTLVSLVEKYGLLDESFAFDQNAEMSQRLKKLNPKFRIGQNVNRESLDARLKEGFLDVFLLTFAPTSDDVERLRQHKKQVLFNYAGSGDARRNPKTWKKVRDAGIDGMLTDYPLECRGVWRGSLP
ncbi:MAG: glycerophosphodiester phosphodiesterase family protein [Rhodopirellula sp.]|nr:glycerophosphodiester phosphodiesterase family protein [Rhodopirellula sp.]